MLQQVELASTSSVTLFEVGGNSCNNAFQLARSTTVACKLKKNVVRITGP